MIKRTKGTGACVIIFKKESLGLKGTEQLATDRLIAPFGQPPAALVPPSDMQTKGHLRKSVHDRVVQLDTQRKPFVQCPAQPFIITAGLGIEK